MRKIFLLFVLIVSCFVLNAQTIALHHQGNTQVFKGNTSFAQAYEASQNGDTLYFSGGTFFPPTT